VTTIAERLRPARRFAVESPIAGPLITLVVVFVLFSIFVPNFLTVRSISGIINAAVLTGTITVGVTMLMIAGEFDLSVAPMMAMGGYLYARGTAEGDSVALAILLALLVPGVMGLLNGLVVTRTRIPSFITTLSTLFIYRGIVWLFSGGQMFQTVEKYLIYDIFNGRLAFLNDLWQGANFRSATLWLIGLVLLFQYVLVRTQFGNHVFAVGGNPGAAGAQGVNVRRVKVICFVLSGLMAGFAGILLFSQYTTVRIATGAGEELKAIAAAVVGGTALTGGSGSIVGALLGVMIISMLRTGVVLTDLIPADNFEAIVGVTIVGAAVFNSWVRSKA
jgi:simple sugar transport system permease protein